MVMNPSFDGLFALASAVCNDIVALTRRKYIEEAMSMTEGSSFPEIAMADLLLGKLSVGCGHLGGLLS
jgi:hypothetical protein